MKRVIYLLIGLAAVILPTKLSAEDTESLTSVYGRYGGCGFYEAGSNWDWRTFSGVPGLSNGTYLVKKTALYYDVWNYGPVYDRSSTPTMEEWDTPRSRVGQKGEHTFTAFSDSCHGGGASFFWKYDYVYGIKDGSLIDGRKRYDYTFTWQPSHYAELLESHWKNGSSQNDGQVIFLVKHKGWWNPGWLPWEWGNFSGSDIWINYTANDRPRSKFLRR